MFLFRISRLLLSFWVQTPQDPLSSSFALPQASSNIAQPVYPGVLPVAAFDLHTPLSLSVASNYPQVPFYLEDQITAWAFVEFSLLLPKNLEKLPKCAPNQGLLPRLLRMELKPLRDFRDWSEA